MYDLKSKIQEMNEAVEIYENKVKKLETELNQRQHLIKQSQTFKTCQTKNELVLVNYSLALLRPDCEY